METDSVRVCRTCGKKNYIFCDVQHEVIKKLLSFMPRLLDVSCRNLPSDVCVACYQMIKTLVFNIEGISDMQKILKIQCNGKQIVTKSTVPEASLERERKRSVVEEFEKKYTNIKLRKINSPEKPIAVKTEPKESVLLSPKAAKIVIVEETILKSAKEPDNDLKRSFMCISCSEKFNKFSDLESHLRTCKTTATQSFKCFCGTTLKTKKALSDHVSAQHKQNKQQHICAICKKVFTTLFNLQNHMMMHKSPHGKLKGIYMCHVCNSKYSDLEGLNAHRTICKRKSSEI